MAEAILLRIACLAGPPIVDEIDLQRAEFDDLPAFSALWRTMRRKIEFAPPVIG